jgi:uncharacterized protein YprB with RNaseH-like and TPR domain
MSLWSILNIKKNKKKISPYISATEFENFMCNDPLCDWLSIVLPKNDKPHPFQSLFNKGIHYEADIIDKLRKKNNLKLVKMSSLNTSREYDEYHQELDFKTTIDAMKRGDTILYSAFIASEKNELRGIPDILVRSDYIKTYFNIDVPQEESIFGSYYYIPIEIKYSTLHFDKSNKTLLNINRTKIYKMQLYVYSKILSDIQGTFPRCAFIIGKNSNYLGHVYFNDEIVQLFYKGLEWLQDVRKNAYKWKDDELIPRLLPNMKNNNPLFDKEKKLISDYFGEITEYWQCSIKHRYNLLDNSNENIYSWKDHNFDINLLGVSKSYFEKIDLLFKINRDEIGLLYPKKIEHNLFEWRTNIDEMFIDFETVGNPDECEETTIYLIVIWYNNKYTYFLADTISHESEKKLIQLFYKYWIDLQKPKIWYWYAEDNFWNKVCKKYNLSLPILWIDLYKVFYDGNVFIKGCKNFKLKSYVYSLKNLNLIKIDLPPEECCNGIDALFLGNEYYETRDNKILESILAYNKFDCQSLYILLDFIRKHM